MNWNGVKKLAQPVVDAVFLLGGDKTSDNNQTIGPSWKFRRKLIFGAYRLAFAMIVFGALTFFWDTSVSNNLVTGGIALITIILTAYVAGATYEDVKLRKQDDQIDP